MCRILRILHRDFAPHCDRVTSLARPTNNKTKVAKVRVAGKVDSVAAKVVKVDSAAAKADSEEVVARADSEAAAKADSEEAAKADSAEAAKADSVEAKADSVEAKAAEDSEEAAAAVGVRSYKLEC